MKKLILITLIVLCAAFLVSCSEYDKDYVYDGESLVGVWQERDFDEKFYKVYEFKADGTVSQICYTYGIVNSVGLSGVTEKYRVEDNNTLVITTTSMYTGKTESETELKFSINDDKELVLHQDGDDVNVLVPYDLVYDRPEKSPIIGKWINEATKADGTVQKDLFWFLDNGECIIFANVSGEIGDDVDEFSEQYIESERGFIQSMLYATTSKNGISICFATQGVIEEGNVLRGDYEISGDRLIISSNGSSVEYKRG